ncbi:MAG TPA: zinc-binding protein [Lentisphaeria bacterium]|nr:MAG: hypothetical protein A2X48_15205 [Lentisphaerae bacterium GWF2_49_21]HBC89312.1 zinc-binding protein [Lentisphaeria bacterium]
MTSSDNYTYLEPVAKLLTLGEPEQFAAEWIDYASIGLCSEHIPELTRMVGDDKLNFSDTGSVSVWAPLHAWRALGQMRAVSAVDALLSQLYLVDENDDDWMTSDYPRVFGMIGTPAIPALSAYLADEKKTLFSRICAMHCLEKIGEMEPLARKQCVDILVGNLRNYERQDPALNAFLILYLKELKSVESIDAIRQAYLSDSVDIDVLGDLEDVEIELGLRSARSTPRQKRTHLPDFDIFSRLGMEDAEDSVPFVNTSRKTGRNDPCPCGSSKKYKKCCLQ